MVKFTELRIIKLFSGFDTFQNQQNSHASRNQKILIEKHEKMLNSIFNLIKAQCLKITKKGLIFAIDIDRNYVYYALYFIAVKSVKPQF